MRKIWMASASLVAALIAPLLLAADHLDGPAASADPTADITDIFAWMSSDARTVYLIMNVAPLANASTKFSSSVQYVLHTTSRPAFGSVQVGSTDILCTFDLDQKISCWANGEYLNGDASHPAGLSSNSGKLRVFAGVRDDPFFFNLDGFKTAARRIADLRSQTFGDGGSLRLDNAGCPQLDSPSSAQLLGQLSHAPDAGDPRDFFRGLNVLSIVVAIDKSLVTAGGPILGVWGSTYRQP